MMKQMKHAIKSQDELQATNLLPTQHPPDMEYQLMLHT